MTLWQTVLGTFKEKGVDGMNGLKMIRFAILFILLIAVASFAAKSKMMSVQVKRSEVRGKPSFLAKIVARLSYGDRVEMLESKGAWIRVGLVSADKDGWMHSAALTKKTIILRPGADDVNLAAASDEIALAGKGFNKQVEGEFRARNPDIDFTWIDRMERMAVTQGQMQMFLEEGELSPQGGV